VDPLHGSRVVRPLGNAGGVLGLKLFLAVWLIVSIIAANIAFAPHPQPTKTILILEIDGQIDSRLLKSFGNYFEANPTSPDFLILHVNSTGGYYGDTLALARGLRSMENLGTRIYFLADGTCSSGCYLLASFANMVYATPRTKIGFNHTYEEVKEIYPQIEVLLYANNRINIIAGILVSPPMDQDPEVCGNELVIIYPFLDGCTPNVDELLASIKSDSSHAYSVKIVALEANAELGTP